MTILVYFVCAEILFSAKVLQLFSEFKNYIWCIGISCQAKEKCRSSITLTEYLLPQTALNLGLIVIVRGTKTINIVPLNRFMGMLDLHMISFNMYLYVYIQKYIQLLSIQSSHKIHWACRQIKRYLAQVGVDGEGELWPAGGISKTNSM